jgi:hypothetical protein
MREIHARFNQPAPQLGNQYQGARVLRSYLRRALRNDVMRSVEVELASMGKLSGGELYNALLADRLNDPRHTPWLPGVMVSTISIYRRCGSGLITRWHVA